MDLGTEMCELLASLYASFETGDATRWEDALSADALLIGTDNDEWWQGRERALAAVRAQFGELRSAGIRLQAGEAEIASTGDSVWAADRPTMYLADGTALPLRLTVVATGEDSGLLIRQMHLSVGAP